MNNQMHVSVFVSLIVALLWSVVPIFNKIVYRSGISPPTLVILSGVSYAACIAVYSAFNHKIFAADLPKLDKNTLALIFVAAALTSFAANLAYCYAIKHYEAFLVTGIAYVAPAFTLLFAWWLLGEKITQAAALGVMLIVVGCGLSCRQVTKLFTYSTEVRDQVLPSSSAEN